MQIRTMLIQWFTLLFTPFWYMVIIWYLINFSFQVACKHFLDNVFPDRVWFFVSIDFTFFTMSIKRYQTFKHLKHVNSNSLLSDLPY